MSDLYGAGMWGYPEVPGDDPAVQVAAPVTNAPVAVYVGMIGAALAFGWLAVSIRIGK